MQPAQNLVKIRHPGGIDKGKWLGGQNLVIYPHVWLVETFDELECRGIGFQSLQQNVDTTTAGSRLVFHLFGALAEFERELTRERTMAGLLGR